MVRNRSGLAVLKALVLAMTALVTACAVGPNYRPPAPPPVVAHNLNEQQFTRAAPEAAWWRQFGDPELASLEQRALQSDLDLQTALARVQAARATFGAARLDYAPHIPVTASYTRSKEQQPGFTAGRIDVDSYTAGFDASWELDLFGYTRRSVQAARAQFGAEEANLANTQVTVAAEVARNYFELRGSQRQLAVAHENLANEREALRLTQVRYDAGRVTELDVDSAQSRLKATEATVPLFEAQARSYGYRLAVLLGMRPGELDAEVVAAAPTRAWSAPLPIGDVSTLLRHRPDVQVAEHNLAAATALVGVATADLFPRVSLSGFVGFLAGDSAQLGRAVSRAWSLSPAVRWTGLDVGTALSSLRASKAQAAGASAAYQKAVLIALEDFEDACLGYGKQQARLGSLVEQSEASRRAAQLAEVQYREGRSSFLVLLDAQRTLLEAEDQVAQAEAAVNTEAVAVYKSLGGIGEHGGV